MPSPVLIVGRSEDLKRRMWTELQQVRRPTDQPLYVRTVRCVVYVYAVWSVGNTVSNVHSYGQICYARRN